MPWVTHVDTKDYETHSLFSKKHYSLRKEMNHDKLKITKDTRHNTKIHFHSEEGGSQERQNLK